MWACEAEALNRFGPGEALRVTMRGIVWACSETEAVEIGLKINSEAEVVDGREAEARGLESEAEVAEDRLEKIQRPELKIGVKQRPIGLNQRPKCRSR